MGLEAPLAEDSIDRWFELVKRCSAEELQERLSGLFFLVFEPRGDGGQLEFETVEFVALGRQAAGSTQPDQGGVRVIPLVKSPRSPYADRISIGRARNCDVVIRHPSISKLHAHLRTREDGERTLTDLGSHNGTRIGDRALSAQVPVPIHAGDIVVFGAVAARTLDPEGLHAALTRLLIFWRPK